MREQEQLHIELFERCASTFSEAIYLSFSEGDKTNNVFGRKVKKHSNGGLSHLLGKAVSGLRCSALLSSEMLKTELSVLSTFNRLHVPLSVVVYGGGDSYISQIRQTGAILFRVSTIQELADWLLIAQVISEKCLTPVVIISEIAEDIEFELPNSKELKHWFGNPDDRIAEPIASQEMVLGSARRRMPAWLHIDQAVLVGANKEQKMKGLEKAAYREFEQKHYPSLIEETLQAYSILSGREQNSYESIGHRKPKNVLICTSINEDSKQDSSLQKLLDKKQTKLLHLKQLNPIPVFDEIIGSRVQKICVLEPISESKLQGQYFASFCTQDKYSSIYKENGWFVESPRLPSIEAALNHLIESESNSRSYWLDVPLLNTKSNFPKHEILLQQIKRDYPELEYVSVRSEPAQSGVSKVPTSVPGSIRKFTNQGPPYAKISRFFDDTFCLHEYAKDELIADPFQAYPVMPIATASFNDRREERELVPVFNPQLCKDIDELVLSCNYGALPSTLITVQTLIESGIKIARNQGEVVSQITPIVKKWVKASSSFIKKNRDDIRKAKDFLVPSIEHVLTKSKSDDEKRAILQNECELILGAIGETTTVIDQKLFIEQERRESGAGELFCLAVNPLACTGCGHCALVGDEPCMSMEPQELHNQELESAFQNFEVLPSTSEYSIKRLIENKDFDPFAALLLNSRLYHTYSASANADMSQDETVFKYYLALIEFVGRPKLKSNIDGINTTIEKLNIGIKELLSNSLPVNQLDALMDVLGKHEESRVNMTQVFNEWGEEIKFSSIEKNKLERKLQVLEELKILRTLLDKGISGNGRPSCTIVLDNSLARLANYPFNPFTVPVLVSESEDTAALTLGVCEGQMRHGLDQIRLKRRAELEASDSYSPSKHDTELVNLSWEDLSIDEQQSLAPVVLFATNDWLLNCNYSRLTELLQNPYPVKVFIIDKGIAPVEDLISQLHATSNSLWSLVTQRNTFITRATLD
ncbi:MAG: hypothetical protein KJP21_00585, partial [Bacteroidia bacterium]|nr:hypothetical protein [Bacteroidia bacterium]